MAVRLLFYLVKYLLGLTIFLPLACSTITLNQKIQPAASDWTMAGGSPEQQNVSPSVLQPPLKLLWSYNCDAGIGYSAISVADAVVFVNTLQGELISLDISSGGKLGQLSFLGKEANSVPLIDNNNIIVSFAGDNKYSLSSYNLLLGEINWRVNLGYLETSPVLFENFVYAGSLDKKQYKIDRANGNQIWSFSSESAIHSTAALSGSKIIFGTDDGMIYCLKTGGGSLLWKYKTGNSVLAPPMIYDNKVFVGSSDSNYYCLTIDSGAVVWKQNLSAKILTGSALNKSSSVVFGTIDGFFYCLDLNRGSIIWKFETNGVIASTPVISGDNLYCGSYDRNLYCINCSNGKLMWKYELDGKVKTSPVIWDNFLITAADYYVYCFTRTAN